MNTDRHTLRQSTNIQSAYTLKNIDVFKVETYSLSLAQDFIFNVVNVLKFSVTNKCVLIVL